MQPFSQSDPLYFFFFFFFFPSDAKVVPYTDTQLK